MRSQPEVVYANRVNLVGLYSPKPVKCTLTREFGEHTWWDREGEFDVHKIGTVADSGCITFASLDYEAVVAWTAGAKAVLQMLAQFAGTGK